MKKILVILFILCSFQSFGQAGLVYRNDTLWMFRSVDDSVQLNQLPRIWGQLTGTLSDQTDLQTALNTKQSSLVSGTNIKTINGTSVLGSGDIVVGGGSSPTLITLANNYSSSSTTRADVTGWNFPVTIGKTYKINIIADYQSSQATTTGGSMGIILSGGAAGTVRGSARGSISAAAVATELAIPIRTTAGAGSFLQTSGVSALNTPHFVWMVIIFTCTTSGTFNLQFGSEVAASETRLNLGSSLIYQILN